VIFLLLRKNPKNMRKNPKNPYQLSIDIRNCGIAFVSIIFITSISPDTDLGEEFHGAIELSSIKNKDKTSIVTHEKVTIHLHIPFRTIPGSNIARISPIHGKRKRIKSISFGIPKLVSTVLHQK
jgi:hypothetical protein